jgi:hypothetical protein
MDIPKIITEEWLVEHQEYVFVFGDNLLRRGKRGAAVLRDLPNSYGFITKKYPNNKDNSFFKPIEYEKKFNEELHQLILYIKEHSDKIFLISKLGAGLANKYKIWQKIVYPGLEELAIFSNIVFLFKNEYVKEK